MTVTLNTNNEQLLEKILWFLSSFKNEGLEIITNRRVLHKKDRNEKLLISFNQIIANKSKGAKKVDDSLIFNPSMELSCDIS